MGEQVELRPEVAAFAQLMECQLRANDRKTGWKADTPKALISRLIEETMELIWATQAKPKRNSREVGREAADIANFAMMVADVSGALNHG